MIETLIPAPQSQILCAGGLLLDKGAVVKACVFGFL
jgi:hypothetical protein